jgi:hypothetical protein
MRRAECREIMAPDKHLRRLVHDIRMERDRDSPGPSGLECERRAPVGDPVDVAPPDAAETGVEVWCGLFGAQDGDRLRPELGVQSVGKPVRRDRAFDIDMRGHAERMHAGIGPPGRVQNDRFARDRQRCLLDRLLHRRPMRLALPSHERPPVIFDQKPEASHASRVPAGIAKPRSSSAGLIAPRPDRWTSSGRSAPCAQAMVSASSSTVPGAPEVATTSTAAA